ncbi:MAG: hypothetical protein LUG95_06750 [Clostridiales bacterium]|nr:hypothetical protein [Clostridiales bacterium]
MNNILPLAVVSLTSYSLANLSGVSPLYESLFERITSGKPSDAEFKNHDEKVLKEFIVPVGSAVDRKKISDIDWGRHCLIVSVIRDGVSVIPKGDTMIKEGDELVVLISQRHFFMITKDLKI